MPRRRAPDGGKLESARVDASTLVLSVPLVPAAVRGRLSAAELEVALAVTRGESNAEIARARRASPRTIANQLASAYRKLGLTGRSELTALLTRGRIARAK